LKAANDPSLINVNLTPEQLATLEQAQSEIAEYGELKDVSSDELNAILSGFVALMPIIINKVPQAPVLVTPVQIAQSAQVNAAAPDVGDAMQQIATKMNAINTGASEADAIDNSDADADADFKALLDKAFGKPQGDDKAITPANSNAPSSNASPQAAANAATLQFQTLPATIESSQLLSFDPAQGFTDTFAPIATNSLQMNVLTNLASQAPHAGAMNPAMQTLAAQIQRNMGNGQTTEFRLQLDPPELGRVEVQMSFGKDKSLKTGIVVEKPETFMMLQRDAQMLERTLQNLGLDTEGGINLELAEQGFDFDGDNKRGGGHDKGGTGAGDGADEMEILESTMTWHVDPNTGHTRYNILA
jgi:flagellar hook-length control protein FliK